jgi:hypothetical protein
MNGRGFRLPVRPWRGALAWADGFGADVADVGVVGDAADGGARHADFVLGAREQVLADALGVGALVGGLPACKNVVNVGKA